MSVASGFIYLIILGMWAAYFVPKWVSNHEEASGKQTEKFNSAIRSVTSNDHRSLISEDKAAKQARMKVRRVIYSSLLTIFLGNLVTVVIGLVALPVLLIPTTALLIYTVHVRRQVVVEQLKQKRLTALERISVANLINEPTEQIKIESRVDFSDSYKEHWIPLLERTETSGIVIIPRESVRDGWEPIAVPKPTYVDAPKAVVPKRIIDLTVPGAWVESQKNDEDLLAPREELFDQVLVEEAAQNRAVNE
jgi:hypothetical protein